MEAWSVEKLNEIEREMDKLSDQYRERGELPAALLLKYWLCRLSECRIGGGK